MTVTSSVPDADPGESRRRMRRQIRQTKARESGFEANSQRSGTRSPKPEKHPNNWEFNGLCRIGVIQKRVGVTDYTYRGYEPLTGRWQSRDPIEERGGLNLYGFVNSKPLGWIDFLGREPLDFEGNNGGFRVNPRTIDDALNPGLGDQARNVPFTIAGYDADYFPDVDEECENMKLVQVISYAGAGDNFGPELDNRGKDKKKSPGYLESGGAKSRSGHPGGIFDAPTNDTIFEKHDRPLGEGTYYLEICAVCCPDTNTERILGCVRFDLDSPTGGVTPGVGGAEKTPEGGFTAPALSGPTRHYRNGRWK